VAEGEAERFSSKIMLKRVAVMVLLLWFCEFDFHLCHHPLDRKY